MSDLTLLQFTVLTAIALVAVIFALFMYRVGRRNSPMLWLAAFAVLGAVMALPPLLLGGYAPMGYSVVFQVFSFPALALAFVASSVGMTVGHFKGSVR